MNRITYKNIQTGFLFFTLFVLVFAFYIEYLNHLRPCPLCIMQRFCTFAITFLCLGALAVRAMHVARIVALLQILVASFGLYFAFRQLWLQSLPATEMAICMPGVDALLRYFPTTTILKTFLWGSNECAKVTWQWLGLSMPGWAAIYFGIIVVANIVLAILSTRRLHEQTELR